jgi:hypothetical protein
MTFKVGQKVKINPNSDYYVGFHGCSAQPGKVYVIGLIDKNYCILTGANCTNYEHIMPYKKLKLRRRPIERNST